MGIKDGGWWIRIGDVEDGEWMMDDKGKRIENG